MEPVTKHAVKDVNQVAVPAEQSDKLSQVMSPIIQRPAPVATMMGQSFPPNLPDHLDLAEPTVIQESFTQTHQNGQSVVFNALPMFIDDSLQNPSDVSIPSQPSHGTPSSPLDELTEEEVHLIETSSFPPLKVDPDFPIPTQDQASASSLVSPPASTHTDDGSNTPVHSRRDSSTISSALTSRHSSRQPKVTQHYTPESGLARRSSTSSVGKRIQERESGSPSVVGSAIKKARRGSRLNSEIVADDESLRLIRELQAEDRGLRRRG